MVLDTFVNIFHDYYVDAGWTIEEQSPVVSCFPCSPLVTVHVVLSCLSSFSPVFPLSPPHTHTCTFHTQYILPHCQVTVSLIWVTHFSCYCLTHLATNARHNLASHKVGLSMFVENRNNHVPVGVGALPPLTFSHQTHGHDCQCAAINITIIP